MLRRIQTPYKTKVVRSASESSPAKDSMALLQIIRWDPSTNHQKIESFEFQKKQDFMVLDLLTAVKAHQDPSLAFRASCCEGVCGSCAMNINGANSLACITYASQHTIVGPLPNFPVIKDLVVDLRHFFKQYEYIRPFVRNGNLHRYQAESIVDRYDRVRHALYADDTKSIAMTHKATSQVHLNTEFEAYKSLLDKVVSVGDLTKVLEVLQKIDANTGITIDKDSVKAIVKKTVENFPK